MADALALSDSALDTAIEADIGALRRALGCAVQAAWHLGRKLTVRKGRLQHGEWEFYLDTIGLPARTAQEAMAIASKYAQLCALPGTLEEARAYLRAAPVERRLTECLHLWPGLAARMDEPAIRTVTERYSEISAWLFEGGTEPTKAETAWAFGVERLFEWEFRGETA